MSTEILEYDCTICLENMNIKNEDIMVLKCNHYYHFDCFLLYLKYNLLKVRMQNGIECPLCKCFTDIEYMMYEIINKYHISKYKIKNLKYNMNILKRKLLLLNIKKCIILQKQNKLYIKEEYLMKNIEVINTMIRREYSDTTYLRKIYYTLMSDLMNTYNNFSF
jgi:hypothetical protein